VGRCPLTGGCSWSCVACGYGSAVLDALATAIGLALLLAVALTGPAALGIRGRAARAASGLIVAAATVVGSTIVLSLMRQLTRPGLLLAQLLVAAVSVGAWLWIRKPATPTIRRPETRRVVAAIRAHPVVAVLACVVIAALVLEFVLAVTVAPNTWDGLSYHLSRAAYWLQYKSALRFPGGSFGQLDHPADGEMLIAWMLSLSGTDRFVALVQWTSAIGCGLCVYLGAVLLGFRRAHAAFAAGLFLLMPIVILESTSTQNDLVAAFFVAGTAVFAVRGIVARSYGDLAVGALALGLAVGTKGTVLIALPSLAIIVGASVWRYGLPRRLAVAGVAGALLAVVALGSFSYLQNWQQTGSAFGEAHEFTKRTDGLFPNLIRNSWTFLDFPGMELEWLQEPVRTTARHAFGELETEGTPSLSGATQDAPFAFLLDTNVDEDVTAFGPLALFVLLPVMVVALVLPGVTSGERVVALSALLALGVCFVALNSNPWIARLLIVFIILGAPLLARVAQGSGIQVVVLLVAFSTVLPSLLMNGQKPVLASDGPNVFDMDRMTQLTIARPETKAVYEYIEGHMSQRSTVGFVGAGVSSWDYPLFGPHRERHVLRFADPQDITYELMRRERMVGVLFDGVPPPPTLDAVAFPAGLFWYVPARA
jgi:hypothetical protein